MLRPSADPLGTAPRSGWTAYVSEALAQFGDVSHEDKWNGGRVFRVGEGIRFCASVSAEEVLRFKCTDVAVRSRLGAAGSDPWVTWSGPATEELPGLLVASRSAALYFNPAMLQGEHVAHTHSVFRWALKKVPEELQPPPPYHRGGATPRCPAKDQVRIALWCASLFPEPGQAPITGLVEDWLAKTYGPRDPRYAALTAAAAEARGDTIGIYLARRSAGAARTVARSKPDLVSNGVRAAAARTASALLEEGRDVTGFLAELDRRIVVAEAADEIAKRSKQPAPVVVDVLWRGRNPRGKLHGVLVSLDDGFGLVAKLHRRWQWIRTDSLEEALATVPEEQFPEAVEACLSRRV